MNNIYSAPMSAVKVMDYLDPQMLSKNANLVAQARSSIDSLQFHFDFILHKTGSTLFMELKK